MAEFSYESDIAPMRGSYFSNANLNDRERRQLQSDYTQKIAPYQDITNKALDRMFDIQNQEISFRRANAAFEEEKLKLREAREASIKYPEISKQFEDAMLGKKSTDQRLLVADIEMQNPSFFATPNGNALLSAVKSKIAATATAEAVDQAKANQLWNMAAQLGMPDIAEKVSSGTLTSDDALNQIATRKKELDTLEKQREVNAKIADQAYKIQTDYIDRSESLYNTVRYADGSVQSYSGTPAEGGEGSYQSSTGPKQFAPTYKKAVIDRIVNLSRLSPDEIDKLNKLDDLQLHSLLGDRIQQNREELYRDVVNARADLTPTRKNERQDDKMKIALDIKAP